MFLKERLLSEEGCRKGIQCDAKGSTAVIPLHGLRIWPLPTLPTLSSNQDLKTTLLMKCGSCKRKAAFLELSSYENRVETQFSRLIACYFSC